MQPKTRQQKEVVELSKTLPPLSDRQVLWAKNFCSWYLIKTGYKKAWCEHCGQEFTYKGKAPRICPHCRAKFAKVQITKKRKFHNIEEFTLLDYREKYQIARTFRIDTFAERHKQVEISINECFQLFFDENGREFIIAHSVQPFTLDNWSFTSSFELRSGKVSPYYINRYSLFNSICIGSRLHPEILRAGYNISMLKKGHILRELLPFVRTRFAEILSRSNQAGLIQECLENYRSRDELVRIYKDAPHVFKIAHRNKYIIKRQDAVAWIDHIQLLIETGRDTHNAFYVCPDNLREAHQRIVERRNRQLQKEKQKDIFTLEDNYKKAKSKYFKLCFTSEKDGINIKPLKSVLEFYKEGEAMHHCVYACKYYEKESSLILSAKDRDGDRLETIEVNLKDFNIIQSRGVHNTSTSYHDKILQLVSSHMEEIKQASKKRTRKKKLLLTG